MVARATTIELVRYAGADRGPRDWPTARFREVALLKGRPIASLRLPTQYLAAGYRRHRLLLLRVRDWGDIALQVSSSGRVEHWYAGEGEPGPYPLTLAGWRAVIATAPDTATAIGDPVPDNPSSRVLLLVAGGLGALLWLRRQGSPVRRQAS